MAKKVKHPEHVNHERWLISYADFITLLFAFFVVMFAVSKVDSKKVGRFEESFSLAVGVSSHERGYLPREGDGPPVQMMAMPQITTDDGKRTGPSTAVFCASGGGAGTANELPQQLAELQAVLEDQRAQDPSLAHVKIVRRGQELVLRLEATAVFGSGDERVKADALPTLAAIADEVRGRDVQVRVEGHTDDHPIRTARFRSNWDLATARATSVVSELVRRGGLPPNQIAAVGYAEFRPIAPNDTSEGRAKNRRVDFVLSLPVSLPQEEPQVDPKALESFVGPPGESAPKVATKETAKVSTTATH